MDLALLLALLALAVAGYALVRVRRLAKLLTPTPHVPPVDAPLMLFCTKEDAADIVEREMDRHRTELHKGNR